MECSHSSGIGCRRGHMGKSVTEPGQLGCSKADTCERQQQPNDVRVERHFTRLVALSRYRENPGIRDVRQGLQT